MVFARMVSAVSWGVCRGRAVSEAEEVGWRPGRRFRRWALGHGSAVWGGWRIAVIRMGKITNDTSEGWVREVRGRV